MCLDFIFGISHRIKKGYAAAIYRLKNQNVGTSTDSFVNRISTPIALQHRQPNLNYLN